jgi:hypothetical protein
MCPDRSSPAGTRSRPVSLGHRLNWNLKNSTDTRRSTPPGFIALRASSPRCIASSDSTPAVVRPLVGDRERADQVGASALEVDALRALVADEVPPSTDEIRGPLLVDEDEVAEQAGEQS